MARRLHVPLLRIGTIPLPPPEAHHARDVLRLAEGAAVQVFDDDGHTASACLCNMTDSRVCVRVDSIQDASPANLTLSIACAVPKGERADWMVEKLSELGVRRFIPLATARSVVLPEGKNKRDRWIRIATEAAKQSRRSGIMQIDPLTPLNTETALLREKGLCLATEAETVPMSSVLDQFASEMTVFVGPEGGWTSDELELFRNHHLTPVGLTDTILRVETAAVVAAGVILCRART